MLRRRDGVATKERQCKRRAKVGPDIFPIRILEGKSGDGAAVQKGHLRRWPLQGKSGRRVKKAGFRKPALQLPILPSGAIGGKYVW